MIIGITAPMPNPRKADCIVPLIPKLMQAPITALTNTRIKNAAPSSFLLAIETSLVQLSYQPTKTENRKFINAPTTALMNNEIYKNTTASFSFLLEIFSTLYP